MHELSVVLNIVDIANKEAVKHKLDRVDAILLDIGSLSGIQIDALDFVWDAAVKDSILEKAEKKINFIKAEGKCNMCNHNFEIESLYEPCPNCESFNIDVIRGNELSINSLMIN